MITTIKDVAREAGVAISTVSKVLNGVETVRPDTRQAVQDAMKKLNYIPNINARALKGRRKDTIGLFLSSIQGEFFTNLAQAIHMQCSIAGFMLNIFVSNEKNTSDEICARILASGVAGAIVFNEKLSISAVGQIAACDTPLVLIDREYAGESISSVVIDSYAGVTLAMNYLIHQGHRRIGFMHGLPSYDDDQRYRAYCDVMRHNHLPIQEQWLLHGYFEELLAYGEMRRMFLRGTPLPDAFFCANDQMAWGCITALKEAGIGVPEQVSVVGFDDVGQAATYVPALTTVHSPVNELGKQSMLELLRLIRAEAEPAEGAINKLQPTLMARASCRLRLDSY